MGFLLVADGHDMSARALIHVSPRKIKSCISLGSYSQASDVPCTCRVSSLRCLDVAALLTADSPMLKAHTTTRRSYITMRCLPMTRYHLLARCSSPSWQSTAETAPAPVLHHPSFQSIRQFEHIHVNAGIINRDRTNSTHLRALLRANMCRRCMIQ